MLCRSVQHVPIESARNGQRHDVTADEAEPGLAQRTVTTRASGRPPEESDSDDPEEQALAILEDSEDRKKKGAEPSAGAGA
jgi:hypothetical protein